MKKILCTIMLLVFIVTPAAFADDDDPAEKFGKYIDLKLFGEHQLSPDGKYLVYTIRQVDWEKNSYRGQIWLANLETGEKRQMTFDDANKFSLDWLPGGRFFTFKMPVEKGSQLFKMAVDGGGPEQITEFEKGFGGYEFSSDGKTMLYTRQAEEDEEKKKIEEKYGSFNWHDTEYGRTELWKYDFESEEAEKLIGEEGLSITGFDWSSDETKIVYLAQPDNKITNFDDREIYLYDMESGESTLLLDGKYSYGGSIHFSPGGDKFAFSSSWEESKTWFLNSHILVYDLKTGEVTNLTGDFDENASPAAWLEDGIYFGALQGMEAGLFRVSPESGEITRVTPDDGAMYGGFSFAENGEMYSFSISTASKFRELYVSPVSGYAEKQVTNFGDQLEGWTIGTKEKISWASTDGATIHGVLSKPADYDPEKRYPLLVIIHGGPTGIDYPEYIDGVNGYAYPIEEWLKKGAVVLQPNYRGSAGFGEAFRSLNYKNLGVGDYWDVISGVDYLIQQGIADPDRLGAMGWSQGGYISAFITTFSDRFKAVSVGAGISDWVDYYYRTDITPFTVQYLGEDPWNDPEVYEKTSPMTHIKNASTPTLIQHGEKDARVPINNAFKLYRGLRDQDVPVYFAIYHGFGHGISKPKERLAMLVHNWNFFNKHLWNEDVEVLRMPGIEEEEADTDTEETEESESN